MTGPRRRRRGARWGPLPLLGAAIALLPSSLVHGQTWPQRSVLLVVPYAAGGSADVPARMFANEIAARRGQQIVVENRPGAGGAIGTAAVFKAQPDGYTLALVGTGPAVLNKMLSKTSSYDPDRMTAIVLTTEIPHVLAVSREHPSRTLAEFVARARQGTSGVTIGYGGTTGQLAALLFGVKAGIKPALVSYRGTGPLLSDILGNHIEAGMPVFQPQASQLRALGVTGEARMPALPDVPTMREAGFEVVATTWNVLLGPPGVPSGTVAEINALLNEIMRDKGFGLEMAKQGARILGGSPHDATRLMAEDTAKYRPIIVENDIK